MVGIDNAAVAGNSSTAREMASVTQQIASGNTKDAGSNSTDPLTEAKILETHQAVYTAGGDPTQLMIKPADSTIVAGFTAASAATGPSTTRRPSSPLSSISWSTRLVR